MIEYILAHNPDDRQIAKACTTLSAGEVIIFPTDTNWVMAVNPFHKGAVEKLYRIKGEEKSHHFSLLCLDIAMASELALIADDVFRIIKRAIPGHYTFIFDASKKMIKALKASKTDHEVGIRFVPHKYVNCLLEQFCGPLLTTNITKEMVGVGQDEEVYSYMLEECFGSQCPLILDPDEHEFAGQSTIYNFVSGNRECVRPGAGRQLF